MKTNFLPGISQVSWGRILLPIGLLLVAIAGILQLYEVKAFFFPESYYATELKLIRKECGMINKGFISLRAEVDELSVLCVSSNPSETGAPPPPSAGSLLPQPATGMPTILASDWSATLHAAKKKRVYVARKLRYLNAVLQSMQKSIQQKHVSHDTALSERRPEFEKSLLQIREIQTRCNSYNIELKELSQKLDLMVSCSVRSNKD
jgi:hypothetical protein